MDYDVDVAIIGAGPAGSLAATMLADAGRNVMVIESAEFPRFCIGESMLPQVTECLGIAGMESVVDAAEFQYKDGAHFTCGDLRETFEFGSKSARGPSHAWEVKRADFDMLLSEEAERRGANIHYRTRVTGWQLHGGGATITCKSEKEVYSVNCRFLLDASGYGRVMSKLADLETPSDLPPRKAFFHHIRHHIRDDDFDPDKITIAQSHLGSTSWFWLIPFADGTASFGVVMSVEDETGRDPQVVLDEYADRVPLFRRWLADREPVNEIQVISGYSCSVKHLFGERFALLGNAAEFVDPIFSSGVSIACRSAVNAVPLVLRELEGESVDWLQEYENPMRRGVKVFQIFVDAWYEGTLPTIFYAEDKDEDIKRYICSILAGFVWDDENPFTRVEIDKLRTLAKVASV